MSQPLGGETVSGPVRPPTDDSPWASSEEAHAHGGFKTVADMASLHGIPEWLRKEGLPVKVLNDGVHDHPVIFTLSGGIENEHWALDDSFTALLKAFLLDELRNAGTKLHFVSLPPAASLGEDGDLSIWLADPDGSSFYRRLGDEWIFVGRLANSQRTNGLGSKWIARDSVEIAEANSWQRIPFSDTPIDDNHPGDDDITTTSDGRLLVKLPVTGGATLLGNVVASVFPPGITSLEGLLQLTNLPQASGYLAARLQLSRGGTVSTISGSRIPLDYGRDLRISLGDGVPLEKDDQLWLEVKAVADLELLSIRIQSLDAGSNGASTLAIRANQGPRGLPGDGSGGTIPPELIAEIQANTEARHARGEDPQLLDGEGQAITGEQIRALLEAFDEHINNHPGGGTGGGVTHADQLDIDHPIYDKAQGLLSDLDNRGIGPTDDVQTVAADGQRTFNLTKPAGAVISCCVGGAPQRVIDFNHPTVVIEGSSALIGQRVVFGLLQETTA